MSQTFTDDCYDSAHVAATDLTNMENNFAALKSCFSGASAPANTVGGMLWLDTTTNILKIRNAGDSAWVSLYDVANDRAFNLYRQVIAGTGLTGGGYLTGDVTLSASAVDTDQIADGAITLAKMDDQLIKIATYYYIGGVVATNSNSYVEVLRYAFICPVGPSYIAGEIMHKGIASDKESEARLRVELASDDSTVATGVKVSQGSSAGWDEFPDLDISGLTPGTKYRLILEMQNETNLENCTLYGFTAWFKN